MKKLLLLSAIQILLIFHGKAQVLNVNNNEQKYDQWCWAGCSKTILDYYGFVKQQCEIADWVRTTATFHDFGSINCCTNASQGCNYWNYNYNSSGSIQDILIHFGSIQNTGVPNALTLAEITTEIQNNRLFVIRWGWSTGGGHFLAGHGINRDIIYFMNPWFDEGLHFGTYNFVVNGSDNTSSATHTWTHTNKITSNISGINELSHHGAISVYPNPFSLEATIQSDEIFKNAILTIYNSYGQLVKQEKNRNGQSIPLYRDNLPNGLYLLQLTQSNRTLITKLIITEK